MKLLIALAAFSIFTLNADTVLSLDPVASVVTIVGSTVTLDVDLYSSTPNVEGFNFSVAFSPLLQAINVTEQGFFSTAGCCFGFSIDNPGVINGISDFAFEPDNLTSATVPDTLVSIQFQTVASGLATVELTCAQGDLTPCNTYPMLWDSALNSIPATLNSLNLTITPDLGTAAPEPDTLVPLCLGVSILLALLVRQRHRI